MHGYDDPEQQWRAVLARDVDADGRFFYGVTSTGIFCRPTCPSRRPKRENARFFPNQHDAKTAGFIACRRCKPDQLSPQAQRRALVMQACRQITEAETPPTLTDLAAAAEMSPHHFQRLFQEVIGLSPAAYAKGLQEARLRQGLADGMQVTDAAFAAGYSSLSQVYGQKDALGMRPGSYRKGGEGMKIRYGITDSPLGKLLVGITDIGVCAVALADDAARLRQDLHERFHAADIKEDAEALTSACADLVRWLERPGQVTLDLDIRGTAFQIRVWRTLRTLAAGETLTYQALADRMGSPKATRAVASACGKNPIALLIPCHRIIRSDGGLGGYRWGLERKEALLAKERALG